MPTNVRPTPSPGCIFRSIFGLCGVVLALWLMSLVFEAREREVLAADAVALLRPRPTAVLGESVHQERKHRKSRTALRDRGVAGRMRVLVHRGLDVNRVDSSTGRTLLTTAVSQDYLLTAGMLLEAGADANRQGPTGPNPLIVATQQRSPTAVKMLLKWGADPSLKATGNRLPPGMRGKTALELASEAALNDVDRTEQEKADLRVVVAILRAAGRKPRRRPFPPIDRATSGTDPTMHRQPQG